MSLEQLIELDIVKFLESELPQEIKKQPARDESLLNRHDWDAEIRSALKRNRPEEAKKIFEQLKQKYMETPESHQEERKRFYEIIQAAYIDIYNSVNDRARTVVLLQKLEQAPDAVFDANTKPVNLERQEHVDQIRLPEFEPLTKQALQRLAVSAPVIDTATGASANTGSSGPGVSGVGNAGYNPSSGSNVGSKYPEIKPIPHFELGIPVAPSGMAPLPVIPGLGPAQVPREFTKQETPAQQKPIYDRLERENIRVLMRRAFTAAATSPERANIIINEIKKHLTALSPEDQMLVHQKIAMLEELVIHQRERTNFSNGFNEAFSKVSALSRLKNENAVPTYTKLHEEAVAFEKKYPNLKGVYTDKLKALQQQYLLYNEDELADVVKPYINRLVHAPNRSIEQKLAVEELQRFIKTLPAGPQRDKIQQLLNHHRQPLPLHAPIEKQQEDPVLKAVQQFIHRLKAAKVRKDTANFVRTLEEFRKYVSRMNNSPDKELLEDTIAVLSGKLKMDDEFLAEQLRPHLRRVAAARASNNKVEIQLAKEALIRFIHALPESQRHALEERVGGI